MKKHAIVIGGTKGTGLIFVKEIAKAGHNVSVIGKKGIKKAPGVSSIAVDITNGPALKQALRAAVNKNGKVSELVFFQRYRAGSDSWEGELDVTLSATKAVIESLEDDFDKNGSSIVLVSSIAGRMVTDEQPISYHVAKAGLEQMARYFAVKLGEKGIRVNAVCPGSIIKEEAKGFYRKNKDLFALINDIIPLKRMGTSHDVSAAVMFLCNESSSFITGQTIILDGGLSLVWQESLARQVKFGKGAS